MIAHVLIREQPYYRRSAFVRGLEKAGHTVLLREPDKPNKETLLVIWNRYMHQHDLACRVELAGGKVIVAENGYIGEGGTSPKFDVHPQGPKPNHYYCLSLDYHNGRGRVPKPQWHERLTKLRLPLKPLRLEGDYVLICPNRSFGVGDQIMHPDWAQRTADALKKVTDTPIRIRNHPGNNKPANDLATDLSGAKAVAIWSSTCGLHALVEGIPVVCAAPYWICKDATWSDWQNMSFELSKRSLDGNLGLQNWFCVWRYASLIKMSYAQWTCSEIESGDPFRRLLSIA